MGNELTGQAANTKDFMLELNGYTKFIDPDRQVNYNISRIQIFRPIDFLVDDRYLHS